MLCQDCKKRQADVNLTQIVNNQKVTVSLCKECAAARGFHSPLDNMPFPLAEILSGMAGTTAPATGQGESEPVDDLTCSKCGLTFSKFTRQGRFGCGECYVAFRPRLEPIMRKIHGNSLHRGRHPELAALEGTATALPVKEEERLENELMKAIGDEDFERAAEIRDMLKSLREQATV